MRKLMGWREQPAWEYGEGWSPPFITFPTQGSVHPYTSCSPPSPSLPPMTSKCPCAPPYPLYFAGKAPSNAPRTPSPIKSQYATWTLNLQVSEDLPNPNVTSPDPDALQSLQLLLDSTNLPIAPQPPPSCSTLAATISLFRWCGAAATLDRSGGTGGVSTGSLRVLPPPGPLEAQISPS